MKKNKQPQGLLEGIYFGLSDEQYHADSALSHSGITNILVSEYDYWENSSLNPEKRFKETDAMKFGKLAEMFLLEEEKFMASYNVAGGGWSQDKKTISRTDFDNVVQSAKLLRADPATAALFVKGYPQVSIFYRDEATGIMMRIRPDYMRTFGCIDLKRLRDIRNSRLGWDCVEYGYDLQEQMYIEGMVYAKKQLRAGKMKAFGKHDPAWLKAFAEDPQTDFRFIFQRSVKPYIYVIKYFDAEIRANAKALVEEGIHKYARAIEKYGPGEWPAGNAQAEEFSIYHFPRRIFDR